MNLFAEKIKNSSNDTEDILRVMNEFLEKHDMSIKEYTEDKTSKITIKINANFKFYCYLISLSENNLIFTDYSKIEISLLGCEGNVISLVTDKIVNLENILTLIEDFEQYELPMIEDTMKRYAQFLEDTCFPIRCVDLSFKNKTFCNKESETFKRITTFLENKGLKVFIKNSGFTDTNELNGYDDISMYIDIIETNYEIINLYNYFNENKNSYENEIYLKNSLMFYGFYKANEANVFSINIITPRNITNNDVCCIWEDVYNFIKGFDEFKYNMQLPDYIFDGYCKDTDIERFSCDRYLVLKRKHLSEVNWGRLSFEDLDSYLIPLIKLLNKYKLSTAFACSGLAEDHYDECTAPYLDLILKNELTYKLFKFLERNLTYSSVKFTYCTEFLLPSFVMRPKCELYPDGKLCDSHTIKIWCEFEDKLNQFMSLNS